MLRIGTSGYSYKEWKGGFYPEDLKASEMLPYYAQRLGTVEINNTFYRLPSKKLLDGWSSQVPDTFRFVLKVSQKITHFKRLKGVEEEKSDTWWRAPPPSEQSWAPSWCRSRRTSRGTTSAWRRSWLFCRAGMRAALEVRNQSWLVPDVFSLLEKHGVALVASQTDEAPEPPIVRTAPWGYLRLRKTAYEPGELTAWALRIADIGWEEAFVFFKHEQIAPDLAEKLSATAAGSPGTSRESPQRS